MNSTWICTKNLKVSCCSNSIKNYSVFIATFQIGQWKLGIHLSLSVAFLTIFCLILSNQLIKSHNIKSIFRATPLVLALLHMNCCLVDIKFAISSRFLPFFFFFFSTVLKLQEQVTKVVEHILNITREQVSIVE